MANIRKHLLEIQTRTFLWSIAIVDFLEMLFFIYKYLILKSKIGSFWNLLALSFFMIWNGCGVMSCAIGLAAIEDQSRFDLLKKFSIPYFLTSAFLKGIFSIVLFLLSSNSEFYLTTIYASSEPILLFLIGKFTNAFASLPILITHLITIVFLMYVAFIVRWYYISEMKKIRARNQEV